MNILEWQPKKYIFNLKVKNFSNMYSRQKMRQKTCSDITKYEF